MADAQSAAVWQVVWQLVAFAHLKLPEHAPVAPPMQVPAPLHVDGDVSVLPEHDPATHGAPDG